MLVNGKKERFFPQKLQFCKHFVKNANENRLTKERNNYYNVVFV